MKGNFKRNLQTGFGISLLLLIVSSVISYSSIRNLIRSSELVDHTNKVIMTSENIISNMKDGETGQRGYLMTRQLDFLAPYQGAYDRTMTAFSELRELTKDDLRQQLNCDSLELMINKRFNILEQSIELVNSGKEYSIFTLRDGHAYMQQARLLVKKIQGIEKQMLAERTSELKRFVTFTPVFIMLAAGLAILITIFFFKKVSDDFKVKVALNEELDRKDKEIQTRINTVENIAQRIAQGDYALRLDEEQKDNLGSLAGSLNKMANALHQSFDLLKTKEWLQAGLAQLGERISGEKNVSEVADELVQFAAEYTDSHVGAVYLDDDAGNLKLTGAYSLASPGSIQTFSKNEGLVGQCFRDGKEMILTDIEDRLYTSSSGGKLRPRSIALFPLSFENRTIGVMEVGTLTGFSDLHLQFFRAIGPLAGITINMASNRHRMRELLEETQSQAEELQMQHRELETLNSELEVQTEKLQSSEEELRVQQEELMETNQELEERSRLLEERNQLIVMRNLEIQKKSEELALSARYKSEFLANMSHELRTPLNSVLLLSRLLKENAQGNLSAEQMEYASVIHSSGTGLLQLIDEILDLSKIESGKMELDYEIVSIADVVNDMNALFAPMAREKNVDFRITTSSGLPAGFEADKLRLEQILKNLISNSLKFTNKGSIELKLGFSPNSDQWIEFVVKDTGIGIPSEKQELIFEAFQQADGSTKRKYGGTGLGLSISRQLARLLGGDITLESDLDKGSEFKLAIPLYRNTSAFSKLEGNGEEIEAWKEEPSPPYSGNGSAYLATDIPEEVPDDRDNIGPQDKVLLIVEDDTAFAKALLDFARKKGYRGINIVRGDQVIDMAKKYHPLGILMDIQLPVKDGLTVMKELKANPSTRHIPVHIMSSFEVKKESISEGAIDFIHKPVAYEQLAGVLERIDQVMSKGMNKVLIVEENSHHAKALGYFLETNGVAADITDNIDESVEVLKEREINCVILDMGVPGKQGYEALEMIRKNKELENIPIIIFTGKSLSRSEEQRIRQYADSVVIKTAHSYQRILNEVSLFLHLVENNKKPQEPSKLGTLDEVLKNRTVLIADDDVRNIFGLGKVLEKHNMKVITAMDGKEAIQLLNTHPETDIVLMDMMMPEMDGYDAIRKIRDIPKWKNLPVIAVTAKAMTGDRDKCIEAGASDYISKPVDTDQLISLMRIWLYDTH
jgi:signal transduction histidine kinase/DNA-binding response OmpR family regulator/CHASE3 domain sensor protein